MKRKEQEIIAEQKKMQQYMGDAQNQMKLKREQLMKTIHDSVKVVINQLAKTKGYDIVLDSSQQKLLIAPPEDDLTPTVKLKLGIK